ncbi:MAG TPA: alkaline phosphatase family protein [Bacteroidales bacterium]|nr:alkaline phosphatase family protein [Bacteroidales bacterium]
MKQFLFLALLLVTTGAYAGHKFPEVRHVVLIGIDGVSAEAFQYSPTPVMDKMARAGSLSLKTRGVMPTVSAPNWATILSGAGPEQHGVTSNNWSLKKPGFEATVHDEKGYFTSIFTLIRQQRPLANTAMFYDWDWLGTYVNQDLIDTMSYLPGFRAVTDAASSYIARQKPYFTFVYYGHPDEIGHEKGFNTSEYYQAITEIDGEIGRLIDSVKYAGIYDNTVFIIVSDHGGKGHGHGGESMIELEVPWMISGPGIRQNAVLQEPNDLSNTAPVIAILLGLQLPVEWTGRPVAEAFLRNKQYNKKNFAGYVSKPMCSVNNGIYLEPQTAALSSTMENAEIRYTLDGTIPDRKSRKYIEPVILASSVTLTSVAFSENSRSEPAVIKVNVVKGIRDINLAEAPSSKYPGQGAPGLVDGVRGPDDYFDGAWMGFEEKNIDATIDFGKKRDITSIGIEFLQQPKSWIFLPEVIEYYISPDGVNWELTGDLKPADADGSLQSGPVTLKRNFDLIITRYLRIKVKNIGACPEGHPGAGQKAWLFISEVTVE